MAQVAPAHSLTDADTAADLRDVFRALYDGEEWAFGDDSDSEVDAVEADVELRYDATRLLAALDRLLVPPTKRRFFTPTPVSPSYIPSTAPVPTLPPTSTFEPFSPLPLLARLRTFPPSSLPPALGPVPCALAGWIFTPGGTLTCASGCGAQWGLDGLDTLPARVRDGVVARLASTLGTRHAQGCAWRTAATPRELVLELRSRLHPLIAVSLAPLAAALQGRSLGPVRPEWAAPVPHAEVEHLAAALDGYAAARAAPLALEPLAAALALFGWYPHDLAAPTDYVADLDPHAPNTHTGATPAHVHSKTEIVRCRICLRRVGLWAFQPGRGRVFDLHREHCAWCPLADDGWWEACTLLRPSETGAEAGWVLDVHVPDGKRRRRA